MYLSLSIIRCMSAALLCVCQTVGDCIEKGLPDYATTHDPASHVGLTKIGRFHEI